MTRRLLTLPASLRALNPGFAAPAKPRRTTATKRTARSVGARRARSNGSAFEDVLDAHHARAAERGIADVRKVGAPVVVGRGGAPKAWAGVGPADYVGTLRGGRSLAVEAKSAEGRLSLLAVAEHQRAHLDAVHALGGLALLAVELRGPAGTFVAVVPWAAVPWRETEHTVAAQPRHKGKAATPSRKVLARTVGREELAAWRVSGDCYLAGYAAPPLTPAAPLT